MMIVRTDNRRQLDIACPPRLGTLIRDGLAFILCLEVSIASKGSKKRSIFPQCHKAQCRVLQIAIRETLMCTHVHRSAPAPPYNLVKLEHPKQAETLR